MRYLAAVLLTLVAIAGAPVRADDLCARSPLRVTNGCRCGIKIVSYRISGEPGQRFTYGAHIFGSMRHAHDYAIPPSGVIELLAYRGESQIDTVLGDTPIHAILRESEKEALHVCDAFAACSITLVAPR